MLTPGQRECAPHDPIRHQATDERTSAVGRLPLAAWLAGSGPDGLPTAFYHDNRSNLTRVLDPDNGLTYYTYDADNRMTSVMNNCISRSSANSALNLTGGTATKRIPNRMGRRVGKGRASKAGKEQAVVIKTRAVGLPLRRGERHAHRGAMRPRAQGTPDRKEKARVH